MIEQQLIRHGEAFSPKLKDGAITMTRLADDVKMIIEQTKNNIETLSGQLETTDTKISNHLNNTNNPHNVTATTVGLGNVANESKETMFDNPTFTGVPKAPTAAKGVNSTQIATTAFVQSAVSEILNNSVNTEFFDYLVCALGEMTGSSIYLKHLKNIDSYNECANFDDYALDEYAGIQPIMTVASSVSMPKSSSSPVFFCSYIHSNDDEIINVQGLLYADGTIYSREAMLWYYQGGATGVFGNWHDSSTSSYIAEVEYYFETH